MRNEEVWFSVSFCTCLCVECSLVIFRHHLLESFKLDLFMASLHLLETFPMMAVYLQRR